MSTSELEAYLEEKGVKNLLKDMLTDMLTHKPENPVLFLYHFLKAHYPGQMEAIADDFDQFEYQKLYCGIDGSRGGGGDDDDEGDEFDEDGDTVGDLQNFKMPTGFQMGSRRISVSAESVNPDTIDRSQIKKIAKPDEDVARIKDVIRGSILFSHLDDSQREIVVGAMFECNFKAGDVIIQQGDDGDNYYVVDSGECEIFVKQEGGEEKKVLDCGPGDSFGELALMYNAPRAATVKAKSDVKVWAVDRVTFKLILMDTTMQKRNKYDGFLKNVPILQTLHEYERCMVADALKEIEFDDGETIVEQGEHGDCFYIVDSGEVDCFQKVPDKEEPVKVSTLKEGQYFGEVALLTGQPRVATVIARGATRCLCLEQEAFNRILGPLKDILKRNIDAYNSYVQINV
eukprot:Rmarinus@m.3715